MNTAEDYAVVVGINDYKNDPYTPLQGAKRDAEDFLVWLKDPAGGNVPPANVDPFARLSLVDGTKPTLSDLFSLLMALRKRAPKGKKRIGRRLYFFLSGHGISAKDQLDEASLVTVDAESSYNACLPGKQSADQLSLTARFDEVLLFMDCCRVTNLLLEPFKIPIDEKPDPDAAKRVKRFYAFATGFGSTAREMEHNGVIRGIFTRALLEGLRNAPVDAKGQRTTTQLKTFLETEMEQTKVDGEPLTPHTPIAAEIVLAEGLPPKRVSVELTLSQPTAGIEVLDGGNNLTPFAVDDLTIDGLGIMHFTLPFGKGFVIRAKDFSRMVIIQTDQDEIHATL